MTTRHEAPPAFEVHAEWDPTGWWVISVPAVPGAITQCRRLDQVRDDAAEVIEIQTGRPVDPAVIRVNARVDGPEGDLANAARAQRQAAREAAEQADERTRTAVAALRRRGFSLRDVGELLGITFQRAHQIAREH